MFIMDQHSQYDGLGLVTAAMDSCARARVNKQCDCSVSAFDRTRSSLSNRQLRHGGVHRHEGPVLSPSVFVRTHACTRTHALLSVVYRRVLLFPVLVPHIAEEHIGRHDNHLNGTKMALVQK